MCLICGWSLNAQSETAFIGDLDTQINALFTISNTDIGSQSVDSLSAPRRAAHHVSFTQKPEIVADEPDALAGFLSQLAYGPWAQ